MQKIIEFILEETETNARRAFKESNYPLIGYIVNNDVFEAVRWEHANNVRTDPMILRLLEKDPSENVQVALVKNPSVSSETIEYLSLINSEITSAIIRKRRRFTE